MIALLQRVTRASVIINSTPVGHINSGLLALIGVQKDDTEDKAARLLQRILGYRIFNDADGRMNVDIKAARGGLLLVPQFTLAADTKKGTRPGFSTAAEPETGKQLFEHLVNLAEQEHQPVACGQFGANMQVELVNDGPVTFWLEV